MGFTRTASPAFFMLLPVLLTLILFSGCAKIIQVTTSEPVQISTNKRSLGTRINDEQLETFARVNIHKASKEFENARINIDSFNGIVLLTGQVPSEQLRQLAGTTVSQINTLRQLHNELAVSERTRLPTHAKDAWISTKIKTKLIASNIQSSRVRIITESQSVYLMGLVSRHEAERVTEMARTTKGVIQVVKVFEYID
ncbi:BON domain-containing protein [Cellvibrio fontiphilus]|jgi:osmotically-inducible protein OsmY|uniref:BON domain-containing protein n=1 Tax=Cellvibrio fontiphilus TaxID=1815559 RepID=A0ABV7FDE7_9GAMM